MRRARRARVCVCACAAELETVAAELRDKHATAEAADEAHASRKAEYADVVLAGAQAAPALAAAITTEKEYAEAGAAEAQAEEVVLCWGQYVRSAQLVAAKDAVEAEAVAAASWPRDTRRPTPARQILRRRLRRRREIFSAAQQSFYLFLKLKI